MKTHHLFAFSVFRLPVPIICKTSRSVSGALLPRCSSAETRATGSDNRVNMCTKNRISARKPLVSRDKDRGIVVKVLHRGGPC